MVPASQGDRANCSQVVRLRQALLWKYREHIQFPAEGWASQDDRVTFNCLLSKFCLCLLLTLQGSGLAHLYCIEKKRRYKTGL